MRDCKKPRNDLSDIMARNAKDFKNHEYTIGKFDEQYWGHYKILELIGDRNAKKDLGNNKIKGNTWIN